MKIPTLIDGAATITVTSGKGGVGKTTCAAALAVAYAQRGVDVLVIDGDTTGPNMAVTLGFDNLELGVNREPLELLLPARDGIRLCTPQSFPGAGRVDLDALIAAARFAPAPQLVIVDLPPGWSDNHSTCVVSRPDAVVCLAAPTPSSLADHDLHTAEWKRAWENANEQIRKSDQRRKWKELEAGPTIVDVENLARFRGIDEASGDEVTIRRIDAVDSGAGFTPVVSLTSARDVFELAGTQEITQLLDVLSEHIARAE